MKPSLELGGVWRVTLFVYRKFLMNTGKLPTTMSSVQTNLGSAIEALKSSGHNCVLYAQSEVSYWHTY